MCITMNFMSLYCKVTNRIHFNKASTEINSKHTNNEQENQCVIKHIKLTE